MNVRELAPDEVERVGAVLGLARLHSENGMYFVAWDGDEPLGHARLAFKDPPEVQDVEVRPEHRRRGVATSLTRAAEEEAARRGHVRVRLTVSEENASAQALYRGLGYVDVGIPPKHVKGTVELRTGPLEFDETLLTWEKPVRPCALFLHGGPGLPDYLDELADELEPAFVPVRHQQRPQAPYAVEDYVADAIDAIPNARVWLVGHSWGGHLALHLAVAHPERVAGLVLVGTLGAVGDGGWGALDAELDRRLGPARAAELDARRELTDDEVAEIWSHYASRPGAMPRLTISSDKGEQGETRRSIDAHFARGTLERALPSLDVPVLVVHGDADPLPLAAAEATAALLPHATLTILHGFGHFPWLERRGSVAEAVVDFARARSS